MCSIDTAYTIVLDIVAIVKRKVKHLYRFNPDLTLIKKGNYNSSYMDTRIKTCTSGLMAVLLAFAVFAAGCAPAAEPEPTATPVPPSPSPQSTVEVGLPCDLPLPGSDDRVVILCELFDDNRYEWQVESQDNPYATYTSTITDGKFVVDYTAKGFEDYLHSALTWFTIGEVKDFALSIKGSMDTPYQDVSWGIALRWDEDSFYLFSISNTGTYSFEIFENDEWITLFTEKEYNGIRQGEENTLRIEAGGQNFNFSINDTIVSQYNEAVLEGEEILLVVSVKEGASAVFAFDDVVLQK